MLSHLKGNYFDSALATSKSTLLKLVVVVELVVAEVLLTIWPTSFWWLLKLVLVMISFSFSSNFLLSLALLAKVGSRYP